MTINKNYILGLTIGVLILSCGQENTSKKITSKEETFFTNYTINIPVIMHKEREGVWLYSTGKKILTLEIEEVAKSSTSLENKLDELIKQNDISPNDNKKLINKTPLKFNGLTGLNAYFEKDQSTGIIPVLTYSVIAIVEDGNNVLKITSVSNQGFLIAYIRNIITSIKRTKIATETIEPKKSEEDLAKDISEFKKAGFQVFEKDNFIIKCDCKLKVNSEAQKIAKQQNVKIPVSAYVCVSNQNDFDNVTATNITIQDISYIYMPGGAKDREHIFTDDYYETYKKNITAANMKLTEGLFNGARYLEYSFIQQDVPTQAIMFIKNKKMYCLQVSSMKNLIQRFNILKSSFKFIN